MQGYLGGLSAFFRGKLAVVTGGGGGIGKSISLRLAEYGARVAVADRDLESARRTVSALEAEHRPAKAYAMDVSRETEVDEVFQRILHDWGALDILVNNAGIWTTTPLEEMSESEWQAVLDTNLKGAFLCSRAALRIMKRGGNGVMVNLSSGAARSGGLISPGIYNPYAHYAASKAGIESLTRSVAVEGARWGIRANAVAPGPILTDAMDKTYSAERKRRLTATVPLGRLGRPEEIADAVLFLASPWAGYITGKTLDVNGGLLMD